MEKLRINMFAHGQDVPGQGVGSAYYEQIALLQQYATEALEVVENDATDGDINHFNTIDPLSYLRCRRSDVPTVMHVHFLPDTLDGSIKLPSFAARIFKNYVMNFYHRADHLVVVNPIFIDELAKYGINPNKVTYIPNYVSREVFHPMPKENLTHLYEEHNLSPDKFTVLGVGQVQPRKGVLDFIKVAEALPEYQFVWCGGFSFGTITDNYAELKEAWENSPANVTFTGIVPREEMNLYYNLADCLFMPSFNELFPMAILEASNIHLPILVRDLELYEDILFGHVMTAQDVPGFVEALTELANSSDNYLFWTNETAEIERFYSPSHVSKLWIDYYKGVASLIAPSLE